VRGEKDDPIYFCKRRGERTGGPWPDVTQKSRSSTCPITLHELIAAAAISTSKIKYPIHVCQRVRAFTLDSTNHPGTTTGSVALPKLATVSAVIGPEIQHAIYICQISHK